MFKQIAAATVFAATVLAAAPAQAAPEWAEIASEFNDLDLLCDGSVTFDLDEDAPVLNGRKAVVDYMVSQAAFGSGVEFPSDLDRVKKMNLFSSNFYAAFDSIYQVVVTFAPIVANAHQAVLIETFDALEAESNAGLYIYENAEPQGGNLEQIFIYDKETTTFGRIELSCG